MDHFARITCYDICVYLKHEKALRISRTKSEFRPDSAAGGVVQASDLHDLLVSSPAPVDDDLRPNSANEHPILHLPQLHHEGVQYSGP